MDLLKVSNSGDRKKKRGKNKFGSQHTTEKGKRSSATRISKWLTTTGDSPPTESVDFLDFIVKAQSQQYNEQRCDLGQRQSLEIYDIVLRYQGNRLDEQRCCLTQDKRPHDQNALNPSQDIPKVFNRMHLNSHVALPPEGGYWTKGLKENEPKYQVQSAPNISAVSHSNASAYRQHFFDKEHFNYQAVDEYLGRVILSVRYDTRKENTHIKAILRHSAGEKYGEMSASCLDDSLSPESISKQLDEDLTIEKFYSITFPRASTLILHFDEHGLQRTHKFGVLLQKENQMTEKQLLENTQGSEEYESFLTFLGERIKLKGFKGFRGGLDTLNQQTGETSIFNSFENHEIMFHISTMLPNNIDDSQQVQKKRHIGNDLVAVVFQEGNTHFSPTMLASNFLHAYIIVRNMPQFNAFRVSIAARNGVPDFVTNFPTPAVYAKDSNFSKWLLNLLIKAEAACLQAEKFTQLRQRTRQELLKDLFTELRHQSADFIPMTPRGGFAVRKAGKAFSTWGSRTANGRKSSATLSDFVPTSYSSDESNDRRSSPTNRRPSPNSIRSFFSFSRFSQHESEKPVSRDYSSSRVSLSSLNHGSSAKEVPE